MVIKAWELQEALKSGLKPLYVVKGNDVYFRDVVYDAFCRLINPDDADLALCVYEDLADVDSVIEQTVTPPFLSDIKVIIVKSAEKADAFSKAKLAKAFASPSDFAVTVIFDGADNIARSDKDKEIMRLAVTVDAVAPDDRFIRNYISEYFASRSLGVSPDAAVLLMEYTDREMARIVTETAKLADYTSGTAVSAQDVRDAVAPSTEFKVYELTNAIAAGQNDKVYSHLKTLLERGEKPAALLATITSQYRRILHASLFEGSDSELAVYLGLKSSYPVTIARNAAKKYTQIQLKAIVDKLVDLEYGFKSGRLGSDLVALNYAVAFLLKKEGN
ncbi:MAG TPA: DNA polymerase III subunit delta [Candidatus Faecicola pullistercoris]|nr:DNA polymerase III subunit delta [Candidatus Faecicola pullistercoris]